MEQKVQLKHPQGKKAISMDAGKYNTLKSALLDYLAKTGGSTHTEMWQGIAEDLKHNKVKFEGNVHWHLEWVKLDLEANKIIERVPRTSPQQYVISKK